MNIQKEKKNECIARDEFVAVKSSTYKIDILYDFEKLTAFRQFTITKFIIYREKSISIIAFNH